MANKSGQSNGVYVIFSFNEHAEQKAANIAPGGGFDGVKAEIESDLIERATPHMARGELIELKGSYKGKQERSFMVTLADYTRIYRALHTALDKEETVLILGETTENQYGADSRNRQSAILRKPDLQGDIIEIGYFGNIDAGDVGAFDAWTDNGRGIYTAMPAKDWQKYHKINATGGSVETLGPDWRRAELTWSV